MREFTQTPGAKFQQVFYFSHITHADETAKTKLHKILAAT